MGKPARKVRPTPPSREAVEDFFAPSLHRAHNAVGLLERWSGVSAPEQRESRLIEQLQNTSLGSGFAAAPPRAEAGGSGDEWAAVRLALPPTAGRASSPDAAEEWPRLESNCEATQRPPDDWATHPREPHVWHGRDGPVNVLWRSERPKPGRALASALRIQERAIGKARKAAPPRGARSSSFRAALQEHYERQQALQGLRSVAVVGGRGVPASRIDVLDRGLSLVRISPLHSIREDVAS